MVTALGPMGLVMLAVSVGFVACDALAKEEEEEDAEGASAPLTGASSRPEGEPPRQSAMVSGRELNRQTLFTGSAQNELSDAA